MSKPTLDYDQIATFCEAGAPIHTICGMIGITTNQWYSLIKKDKRLRQVYEGGKARMEMALALKLRSSNSPHVLIFRAKAVLGMSETAQKIELSGPDGKPIQTETKTDNGAAFAQATELLGRLTAAARGRADPEAELAGDGA